MGRWRWMVFFDRLIVTGILVGIVYFGWQVLLRHRQEPPPPASAVSIAEPEKKAVPVEKKPVAKKKAAKKIAKKKLPPPPPPAPRLVPVPATPPRAQEECATVEYAVMPGDEVRFAVLAQKRLPASACWRLCDGADCAAPPSPCDVCDWIGPMSLLPEGFEPLHTGRYVAQSAKQSLRLPREARVNFVALCVEREGFGGSNSWIVDPSAWGAFGEGMAISVPYGGIVWPVWGEEVWPVEYSPGY